MITCLGMARARASSALVLYGEWCLSLEHTAVNNSMKTDRKLEIYLKQELFPTTLPYVCNQVLHEQVS